MEKCLQCGKELTHVPGRKEKSFCDVNCRNKHFYAKRKQLLEFYKTGTFVSPSKEEPKEEKKKQPVIPKNNDPKEGSMAFHLKYGASTYAEAEKLKNTQE